MSTRAEQETTIRWDEEEQVYWLGTASPVTLRAWQRVGFPIRVLGKTQDGEERSWEVKIPVVRPFPWRMLLPAAPKTPAQIAAASRLTTKRRLKLEGHASGEGGGKGPVE